MPNSELPKDAEESQQSAGGDDSGSPGKQGSAAASYSGTNEDRLRQEQEIEDMIRAKPPVGKREDLTSLEEELQNNVSFSRKMPDLKRKYKQMRRIRGDGSCFFRGFIFRLMEVILHQRLRGDVAEYSRVKAVIGNSLGFLVEQKYKESEIEMFCTFANEILMEKNFPKTQLDLEAYFADEESTYLVWFCRLLCAGYVKHDWDNRFSFFVIGEYASANDYCAKEVEPPKKECEQLQIIALCEYLGVRICVEYLDASANSDVTTSHCFGPEEKPISIYLLYRPGHYDVLYATKNKS